jgi:hypothetical protein
MLLAIAQALLTLLGEASERTGMDADWFAMVMPAFEKVLEEHAEVRQMLAAIRGDASACRVA